jgi:hypothetical protein
MLGLCPWIVALPLALALGLPRLVAQEPAAPLTDLAEFCQKPAEHLGRTAQIVFQVHEVPATWSSYVTRFDPGSFVAVSAWGDRQVLWHERDWKHPLALLFARRGSAAARQLAAARPYDRFAAVVSVREVFLGRPWLEIERIQPLAQKVSEGCVLHAARALSLMAAGEWRLAREDVARARAGDLPEHAARALAELAEVCEAEIAARRKPQIGGLVTR